MSQSDYIKIKQNRTILRDQIAYNRTPEKRAGVYTELKGHSLAEHTVDETAAFYTPAFPIGHKVMWGIRMNVAGCPNIQC